MGDGGKGTQGICLNGFDGFEMFEGFEVSASCIAANIQRVVLFGYT
jgi:hypothetical protein